jgi:hypothetical protein
MSHSTVNFTRRATCPDPLLAERMRTISIARSELAAFIDENWFFRGLSRMRASVELRILVPPCLAIIGVCCCVVIGVKVGTVVNQRRSPPQRHRVST